MSSSTWGNAQGDALGLAHAAIAPTGGAGGALLPLAIAGGALCHLHSSTDAHAEDSALQ